MDLVENPQPLHVRQGRPQDRRVHRQRRREIQRRRFFRPLGPRDHQMPGPFGKRTRAAINSVIPCAFAVRHRRFPGNNKGESPLGPMPGNRPPSPAPGSNGPPTQNAPAIAHAALPSIRCLPDRGSAWWMRRAGRRIDGRLGSAGRFSPPSVPGVSTAASLSPMLDPPVDGHGCASNSAVSARGMPPPLANACRTPVMGFPKLGASPSRTVRGMTVLEHLLAKMSAHFVDHLLGEIRASVEHRHHDAFQSSTGFAPLSLICFSTRMITANPSSAKYSHCNGNQHAIHRRRPFIVRMPSDGGHPRAELVLIGIVDRHQRQAQSLQ